MKTNVARNLAWKLNWWRQSELAGALLLGKIAGLAEDAFLTGRLIKHCAEEAEHSRIWAETIAELELPHIRIFRSYQSFYLQQSGAPANILEVLCFTQIFERRVHTRFTQELRNPETPEPARAAYRQMLEDEKEHLAWVAEWLGDRTDATETLQRYREIDQTVLFELQSYENCLWTIPNLGREPATASERAS